MVLRVNGFGCTWQAYAKLLKRMKKRMYAWREIVELCANVFVLCHKDICAKRRKAILADA